MHVVRFQLFAKTRGRKMRRRFKWSKWSALGLLIAAVAAGSAMAAQSGRSLSSSRAVVLSASVPRLVFQARGQGALRSGQRLRVALPLRLPHAGALDRFAAAQSTPGNPDYRRFLTPSEFAVRFGAPADEIQRAVRALRRLGLQVAPPSRNHLFLSATGTVGTLERAFRVRMENFRLPSGHTFYANTSDITLPASLRDSVTGVLGLDNSARPQPRLSRPLVRARKDLADRVGRRSPKGRSGGATPCAAAVGSGGYTAPDLAQAYDYNGMYAKGFHGEGVSAAVAEFDDYHDSNVATMESCYGVHIPVSRRLVDGGVGGPPEGGEVEDMADITTILELDPRLAHLYVYEAPITGGAALLDEGTAELDLFNAYVQDDKAPVMSVSWGYCEQLQSASYDQLFARIAEEAAVQGQQIFDASGDSGAVDCPSSARPTLGSLSVEQEAAMPWITGVGGTDLGHKSTVPGSGVHDEATWNDAAAAGGGQSAIWTMPSWQAAYLTAAHEKVPGAANDCGAPKGQLCRMVPDISMNADPLGGVVGREGNPQFKHDMGSPGDDYYCGTPNCNLGSLIGVPLPTKRHHTGGPAGWGAIGGTSLAAPTAAAAAVLWDQQSRAAGLSEFGFLNPMLYQVASKHRLYVKDFHDITTDSNSAQYDRADCPRGCNPHHLYRARTGYDMASGLGSVDVAKLGQDLVRQAATVTLTPSSQVVYGYVGGPSTTAPVSITTGYRTSPYTATSSAHWLQVSRSGHVPGRLYWEANPTGLPPGTRTGQIVVKGKHGSTATLTVRYEVSRQAQASVSPHLLRFSEHAITSSGARTQPRCGATVWNDELKGSLTSSSGTPVDPHSRGALHIANTGPAGSVLHYSAFFHTRTSSWLTEDLNPHNNPHGYQTRPSPPLVPTVGSVKSGKTATVKLASIANANGAGGYPPMDQGTYTGVVEVRDLANPSLLVTVPVRLVLGNGRHTPTIAAAPQSITVTLAPGQTKSLPLVLSDASHRCGYAYSLQITSHWVKINKNLLSGGVGASPAHRAPSANDTGEGNGYTPLTISAKGLAPGIYHAQIIVQSETAVRNPTIVPVTLTVGAVGSHGVRGHRRGGGSGFTG
jgi:Pro-kumamolisin, activation domain